MVRIGEIEVQFLIEGDVATEYPDPKSDEAGITATTSKYIEATVGSSFGIRYTLHKDYKFSPAITFLCFDMQIDGCAINAPVIKSSEFQNRPVTEDFFPTASTGSRGEKMKRIAFGNLDTVGEFGSTKSGSPNAEEIHRRCHQQGRISYAKPEVQATR